MADSADITMLLDAAREGDRGALDSVLARLYSELHSMARRQLAGQTIITYDIEYAGRQIWGATANMLLTLYRMLRETTP